MDTNNNDESEYTITRYISCKEVLPSCNNQSLTIKTINKEIKKIILEYGPTCIEFNNYIVIDLSILLIGIKISLSLYKYNTNKELIIKNNDSNLLIEILKYLTDENNHYSIVRKLNRLYLRQQCKKL